MPEEEGPWSFWEEIEYRFWVCLGCDTGTLDAAWTCQGNQGEDGNQIYDSTFYPKRAKADLVPKRFKALPEKLFSIYREIIHAYNGSLNVLCAAGARALLEGICEDKGISGKNIEEKVEGLKRLLPANIVDDLHGFRFIGNRALHELEAPSREDLGLAIEIIEDLLNFIYELDYKASRLAAKKPRESSISPDEL